MLSRLRLAPSYPLQQKLLLLLAIAGCSDVQSFFGGAGSFGLIEKVVALIAPDTRDQVELHFAQFLAELGPRQNHSSDVSIRTES